MNKSMYYNKLLTTIGERAVKYDIKEDIINGLTKEEKVIIKRLCIKVLKALDNE